MKSMFDSLYRCISQIEGIKVRETYMFYSDYKKALEENANKSKL